MRPPIITGQTRDHGMASAARALEGIAGVVFDDARGNRWGRRDRRSVLKRRHRLGGRRDHPRFLALLGLVLGRHLPGLILERLGGGGRTGPAAARAATGVATTITMERAANPFPKLAVAPARIAIVVAMAHMTTFMTTVFSTAGLMTTGLRARIAAVTLEQPADALTQPVAKTFMTTVAAVRAARRRMGMVHRNDHVRRLTCHPGGAYQ